VTDHACIVCTRAEPTAGWTTCRSCFERLDFDLERIAELCSWAAEFVAKANAANMASSTPANQRLPIDPHALDAATGRAAVRIESWERMTREHFGLTPWPPPRNDHNRATYARHRSLGAAPEWSLWASVEFLRHGWLERMVEDPTFPVEELAGDVRAIRYGHQADAEMGLSAEPGLERFATDVDKAKPGVRIKCPADHPDADGRTCDAWLVVDPEYPTEVVSCRRCRTDWTAERLVLVANSVEGASPVWSTAEPLCDFLRVEPATLAAWARRQLVTRRRTPNGEWIYNIHEAHQAKRTEGASA
jgi:hypothetical protein